MHGFIALDLTRLELGDAFCGMRGLEDPLTGECALPPWAADMCSDGGLVLAPLCMPASAANDTRMHAAGFLVAYESVAHMVILGTG